MIWSDEQVENLKRRQTMTHLHPYTCGNGCGSNLEPTNEGWFCPKCQKIIQTWAHGADLTGEWPKSFLE